MDPSRTAAWERLAELLARQAGRGRDAEIAWEHAEQAGSREALFALARIASGEGRSSRAAALYRRYLAEAAGGVHAEEAHAALEREERRQGTLRGAALGAALCALLAGGLSWARRRLGLTLDEWLKRDPGATRDARSVAGRLSHEAFKHGGLLLGEAVERLGSHGGLAGGRAAARRTPLRDVGRAGARRRGADGALRARGAGAPPGRAPEPALQGPASLSRVSRRSMPSKRAERDLTRLARTGSLPARRIGSPGRDAPLGGRGAQPADGAAPDGGARCRGLHGSPLRSPRVASRERRARKGRGGAAARGPRAVRGRGRGRRVRVRVPEGDWATLWRNLFANALAPRASRFSPRSGATR